MRAFVYPKDGFVVSAVRNKLLEEGYTLVAVPHENLSGSCTPGVYQGRSIQVLADETLDTIATSDVVVFYLPGNESASKEAISHLANLGDKTKHVFIGISSPLTWSRTIVPNVEAGNDNEGSSVRIIPLAEKDAVRRVPSASAHLTLEAENVIVRLNKPDIRAHVICPGILYGDGEDDGGFNSLWKSAWEASHALYIIGNGKNILPTIHIMDLVKYVACVAREDPELSYLLAVDGSFNTQNEIVDGIAKHLGTGKTRDVEPFVMHLPMQPSIPERILYHSSGILANIMNIGKEYLEVKNLTPLKLVVMGPPMAGKSELCRRLSQIYTLKHIDAKAILNVVDMADEELRNEVQSELGGKGGRVSDANMAKLCRILLVQLPTRNQGYILDGWPKSIDQAKELFTRLRPLTPEEKVEIESNQDRPSESPGDKSKNRKSPPKKGKKGGKPSSEEETPVGLKRVPDIELFPNFLLKVEPDETTLRSRLAAAAEAEDPVPHNNEKDFLRRHQAYVQARKEDEADLAAKVSQVQRDLKKQKQAELKAKSQADEMNQRIPLRQRRMMENIVKSTQSGADADPVKISLPEHGGFVGFFADRAQIFDLGSMDPKNPNLGQLVEGVKSVLSSPHNFHGFVTPPEDLLDTNAADCNRAGQSECHLDQEKALEAFGRILELEAVSAMEEQEQKSEIVKHRSQPLKRYLLHEVIPLISNMLIEVCRGRPQDPIGFLAQNLIDEAEKKDASISDPYESEIYMIQKQKMAAKADREEQRKLQAIAKAERDATARVLATQRRKFVLGEAKRRMSMRRASVTQFAKSTTPKQQ